MIIGALFFVAARRGARRRLGRWGLAVGAIIGAFATGVTWAQGVPASSAGKFGFAMWTLVLWSLWGWGLSRLCAVAFPEAVGAAPRRSPPRRQPPAGRASLPTTAVASLTSAAEPVTAEARAISRRRFLIQMGGLAATIVVAGAGVAEVLKAETAGADADDGGPVTHTTFPNDDSPVEPAPGTRAEYTPVADHFRTDIALSIPKPDETTWRLIVDGAVEKPLALTLEQLRSDFPKVEQFVTLSCIDNLIGGPLIATTLWTGTPLRDVIAEAEPLPDARFAHIYADDGFDEEVDLELARSDPRIMLTYAWDGLPLPAKHGFPLRVLVPGRYGMKQPKWITRISLLGDSIPGYWVSRGWDETAEVRTTSVIDTVATKSLVTRAGITYVPIGGIAYSGAKGISKVEIQVDDRPWQAVALREPLSELTWVIWRYDWPFSEGKHYFAVRCYDGEGVLQQTEERQAGPNGATGLYQEYREF